MLPFFLTVISASALLRGLPSFRVNFIGLVSNSGPLASSGVDLPRDRPVAVSASVDDVFRFVVCVVILAELLGISLRADDQLPGGDHAGEFVGEPETVLVGKTE